jgi:hypothetical protein
MWPRLGIAQRGVSKGLGIAQRGVAKGLERGVAKTLGIVLFKEVWSLAKNKC